MDFVSAGRPTSNVFEEDTKSLPFFENNNNNNNITSPERVTARGGSKAKSNRRGSAKSAAAALPALEEDLFQSKRKSVDNIMAMYNTNPMNQMQMNQMNMNPSQQMPANPSNFNNNGANEKAMEGYQSRLLAHQTVMMQQMQQQMQQMRLNHQKVGGMSNNMGVMNPMMQQQQMNMMNPMMQQQQMNMMMQMNNMQMMGGMPNMQQGMGNPGMNSQFRNNFASNKGMSFSDLTAARHPAPTEKNDPFASLG